jgi:hypothetical protein
MYVSGFVPGMPATFSFSEVCIGACFHIDLTGAQEWDSHPILDFDPIDEQFLAANIRSVRDILMRHGNLNGIGGIAPFLAMTNRFNVAEGRNLALNSACQFIFPRINKLLSCIISGNMGGIRHAADDVVGFGPGLTPSADDFLCGLMVCLLYSDAYYGRDPSRMHQINHAIIGNVRQKTTTLSAEMLRLAAQGRVAEAVRRLLHAIFTENNLRVLEDRVLSVLDHGETSGTDLAVGIYAGCLLATCFGDHGRSSNLASSLA